MHQAKQEKPFLQLCTKCFIEEIMSELPMHVLLAGVSRANVSQPNEPQEGINRLEYLSKRRMVLSHLADLTKPFVDPTCNYHRANTLSTTCFFNNSASTDHVALLRVHLMTVCQGNIHLQVPSREG